MDYLIVIGIALGLSIVCGFILGFIKRMWAKALQLPLQLLIWILAATIIFDPYFPMVQMRKVTIALALFWFAYRWVNFVHNHYIQKEDTNRGQVDALSKLATIVIIIGAVLVIMQILEVNIGALIAIGGFGSVAVGFAGRDVLGNLLSGLMLYITHPFRVGDTVETGSWVGEVERIGWYYTSIRISDRRPVYIPNSLFSNAPVVNPSRRSAFEVSATLALRPGDLPLTATFVTRLTQMLRERPDLNQRAHPTALFAGYDGPKPLVSFSVLTKTSNSEQFNTIRQEIMLACGQIAREHGVAID